MNTKKNKNKNKPKPTNLNPPQNEEVKKLEANISLEIEERVPEIVSEVIPKAPEKISEIETPKKPKRNRGKKKKSEKEDDDQQVDDSKTVDQKPPEEKDGISESKLDSTEPIKATEIVEASSKVSEGTKDVSNITPTARKKKNKNKKILDPTDGPKSPENVEIKSDLETIATVIQEPTGTVYTTDNETKTPKKKNKKKKRTDSEKSEETLAVTAAFQKLLEAQDERKDKQDTRDSKLDDAKLESSGETQGSIKNVKGESMRETLRLADVIPEVKPKTLELGSEEFTKSNKKSKKDKKHRTLESGDELQKNESESIKPLQDMELKSAITDIERKTKQEQLEQSKETEEKELSQVTTHDSEIVSSELSIEVNKNKRRKGKNQEQKKECEEVRDSENTKLVIEAQEKTADVLLQPFQTQVKDICSSDLKAENEPNIEDTIKTDALLIGKPRDEEETCLKSKARIAKPVEKKRKEKLNVRTEEEKVVSKKEQASAEIHKPGEIEIKKTEEMKDLDEKLLGTTLTIFDEPSDNKDKESNIAEYTKSIDVSEQEKGKKRNKSPKASKMDQKTDESKNLDVTSPVKNVEFLSQAVKPPEFEEPAAVAESEIPKAIEIKSKDQLQAPNQSLTEITQPESEPVPSQKTIDDSLKAETSEIKENKGEMQIPEINSKKKRKKSPKPPKNKSEEKLQHKDSKDFQSKDMDSVKCTEEPLLIEDTSTTTSPSPLQEIEIRSVKTEESEGSICDITPDIHYPRSSSEVDDNNNMSIHEISTEPNKLTIPLTSPIIQGSGETPLTTPELRTPGVEITEMSSTSSKIGEEKTDLKSKVMEVNKSMEDLRMSIERSLAELTAIEKSEKNIEKQYGDSLLKTNEIKDVKIEPHASDVQKMSGVEKLAEIIAEQTLSASKAEAVESIEEKTKLEEQEMVKPVPETELKKPETLVLDSQIPPIQPPRRENKGKGKSKKKGKQETEHSAVTSTSTSTVSSNIIQDSSSETKDSQETKKEERSEIKPEKSQEKGKQQSAALESDGKSDIGSKSLEPIEMFEDAMTSSANADDVNITFEIIANEAKDLNDSNENKSNPEINVTAPVEDDEKKDKQAKRNQVSPSKNLLGRPDIPVRLNKPDYKKERNKTPNTKQARVKIKDDVSIEVNKHSKESQTDNRNRFLKDRKSISETITCMTAENEDFVYKYSFRKVFLPNACHVCKKDLKQSRVPCSFCNLVFYCCSKHKDEDYQQHQGFCFAVSTIGHLKDQKHIYGDSQGVTGHDYRLLRMQMIVSCEKVLKRKLQPWEQEALLYPRLCADAACREWRQGKLKDCEGCGQVAFCGDKPDHLPSSHQRWCKSYLLYHKLVCYQQTKGRLEPKLPTRVMTDMYQMPEKFNEVLASMYEEKIDMNDIQYAALTQIATAPLTAAYCQQLYTNRMNASYANGVRKKTSFTIHVVGAELQFEADALNKWELFFLHLRPDITDLRVVLIGQELNPSNLPLDLLGKIKICENCRQNHRRVIFEFQDKKSYQEYWATDFILPDLVCAFNPSIQRSSIYNGRDTWPSTIKCITKLKVPFVITAYTLNELTKDLAKIKDCSEVEVVVISEPKYNAFASVRPDRNFISDDEIPLLFKNYCFTIVCGAL